MATQQPPADSSADDLPDSEAGFATQVDDPEDFAQRERLRELFDARQQVQEDRRRIADARINNRARSQQLRALYRASLGVYLRELEPLMTERYPKQGLRHWYDANLGVANWSVTPATCDRLDGQLDGNHKDHPPSERVGSASKRFIGLRSILNTEDDLTVFFEVDIAGQRGASRSINAAQNVEIPFHILDEAYRHGNSFMGAIGLEATDNDDASEFEQKYDDII